MATLLKTLTLSLDGTQFECQLDQAEIVDEPTTEEVQTFCGTDTFAAPNYKLNLGGFQDYGDVNSVCEIIHTSYTTDPTAPIAFSLTVGGQTRSGTCKPSQDVAFGGTAGSALKFTVTLDIEGTPTES